MKALKNLEAFRVSLTAPHVFALSKNPFALSLSKGVRKLRQAQPERMRVVSVLAGLAATPELST